jgi:transcriptional regulator with XRE-family HTH domain
VDIRIAFGRRVRSLRVAEGLSQEALAERAQLHWTYISGIERGRRSPTLVILGRLAKALGTTLPELVTLDSSAELPRRALRRVRR